MRRLYVSGNCSLRLFKLVRGQENSAHCLYLIGHSCSCDCDFADFCIPTGIIFSESSTLVENSGRFHQGKPAASERHYPAYLILYAGEISFFNSNKFPMALDEMKIWGTASARLSHKVPRVSSHLRKYSPCYGRWAQHRQGDTETKEIMNWPRRLWTDQGD